MASKNILALFSAALLMLPLPALCQSHDQLVERYANLAGSKQNAESLIRGLRDGETVTLSDWPGSLIFIPPTGKMGYGNVEQALALAQASLAKHGVTDPTVPELAYALMGGNVKTPRSGTIALDGVLRLRAEGRGWGQIAHAYGVKLGEVRRIEKVERAPKAKTAPRVERVAHAARPEKPERPEKTK